MKEKLSKILLEFFEKNKDIPKETVEEFQIVLNKVYDHASDEAEDDVWVKGGDHYKDFKIQPSQFINQNDLGFAEGNVIKYICRHTKKDKKKDILKAIHYCEMIIDRDYD
tara:strand:+ start:852 stop:1181 length:330 start_codon:yes stop_codon:yes gene_type:complete